MMKILFTIAVLCSAAIGQTLTDSNQNVVAMRQRVCMIVIGADNGSALASADIAPQTQACKIPVAGTIQEVSLAVDNAASTTSAQLQIRHCTTFSGGTCTTFSTTNVMSGVLAAPASGAAKVPACAKTAISQTCIDGTTSSGTVTLSATAVAAGDYLDVSSGTADASTKRITIAVVYQVN